MGFDEKKKGQIEQEMIDNEDLDIFKGNLESSSPKFDLEKELYRYITPRLVIKKKKPRENAKDISVVYDVPFKYCTVEDFKLEGDVDLNSPENLHLKNSYLKRLCPDTTGFEN